PTPLRNDSSASPFNTEVATTFAAQEEFFRPQYVPGAQDTTTTHDAAVSEHPIARLIHDELEARKTILGLSASSSPRQQHLLTQAISRTSSIERTSSRRGSSSSRAAEKSTQQW
ncbi:unnamed protein product, partial [Amoebophrya sp. A120]